MAWGCGSGPRATRSAVAGGLQAHHLANGARHFGQSGLALAVRGGRCHADAVAQMIVEQSDRHLLQCPCGRRDLDDHVGAPGISVDHFLQPTHLPFDLAQPGQIVELSRRVPRSRGWAAPDGAGVALPLAASGGGPASPVIASPVIASPVTSSPPARRAGVDHRSPPARTANSRRPKASSPSPSLGRVQRPLRYPCGVGPKVPLPMGPMALRAADRGPTTPRPGPTSRERWNLEVPDPLGVGRDHQLALVCGRSANTSSTIFRECGQLDTGWG